MAFGSVLQHTQHNIGNERRCFGFIFSKDAFLKLIAFHMQCSNTESDREMKDRRLFFHTGIYGSKYYQEQLLTVYEFLDCNM